MRFFVAILFFALLVLGCSNDKPDNLLAEDTYVDLLVELQLLRSYQQNHPNASRVDSLRNVIFDKYNANEEQFKRSHEYYQQDIDRQSERIKEAIERLRKDRIADSDTAATQDQDSTITDSLP